MPCVIVDLDDPWEYITPNAVMCTTSDPSERKLLKYLNWSSIRYNNDTMVILAWQALTDDIASVSGWVVNSRAYMFIARRIYAAFREFLHSLRVQGYKWIHASTLKTNNQGIRFNQHAGYKRVSEDDALIYWELANG